MKYDGKYCFILLCLTVVLPEIIGATGLDMPAHWIYDAEKNFFVKVDSSGKPSDPVSPELQIVKTHKLLNTTLENSAHQILLPADIKWENGFSISFDVLGGSSGTIISDWDTKKDRRVFVAAVDRKNKMTFAVSSDGRKRSIYKVRNRTALKQGKWYHFTLVADGRVLKIFMNGFNDSGQLMVYDGKINSNDMLVDVGASDWFGDLKGKARKIRFFNKPLRYTEIFDLAGKGQLKRYFGPLTHLLYFSFASPKYDMLSNTDLMTIKSSQFTGVCCRLAGAYEDFDPEKTNFTPAIDRIKKHGIKKVWPVVFFNTFFGSPGKNPCRRTMQGNRGAERNISSINGLDLYDDAGMLSRFKQQLATALVIARKTQAPGVFIDPEAYNCYDSYHITRLSARYGKSPEKIIERLQSAGAELADLTNRIYPGATLFFYIMDFGYKNKDGYERSIAYIGRGILERAKNKQYQLKLVDGWNGDYIYASVDHARHVVETQLSQKSEYLERYENLALAGVVAPFESLKKLPPRSWIRKGLVELGKEKTVSVNGVADFKDIYQYLFDNFKLCWVYGATQAGTAVGYELFSPILPDSYQQTLDDALKPYQKAGTYGSKK